MVMDKIMRKMRIRNINEKCLILFIIHCIIIIHLLTGVWTLFASFHSVYCLKFETRLQQFECFRITKEKSYFMATEGRSWWLKGTYFLSGARGAFIARFLPLVFVEMGLSDSQIGIVLSSAYFSTCFLVPIISAFADLKQNNRKNLLLIIAYILTAIIAILYLLPYFWFNIRDDDIIFYWSLIIMIFYSIPSEFATPILDALSLLVIANNKKKYGQIRSFTAMSWGLFHILVGVGLEFKIIKLHYCLYLYGIVSIPLLFTTYFSFHSIDFITENTQKLRMHSISSNKQSDLIEDGYITQQNDDINLKTIDGEENDIHDTMNNNTTGTDEDYGSILMLKRNSGETMGNNLGSESKLSQYLSTLKFIFSKSYTIGLFMIGFTFGGGWVTVQSLLFVYITDLAQTDDGDDEAYLLMGLSVGISVVFEIPFMYCSEYFVNKFGYRNMIFIGFSCYILRLFGYTLLTADNLWLLLVIETLQGFTMGLVHVAIVTLCAIIFPKHLSVTAQGLMSSIRFGFAPFIFLFISGYIMEYFGGQWLYRGLACIVAITLVLFYFLSRNLNQVITEKMKETKTRAISIASDVLK